MSQSSENSNEDHGVDQVVEETSKEILKINNLLDSLKKLEMLPKKGNQAVSCCLFSKERKK